MLRFKIKDINADNPLYFAEVVSGDRVIGSPKYNGYLIAARDKDQSVLQAIGAIPVSELTGGKQLMPVNIYRVHGKAQVVTPSEFHIRKPSHDSVTKDIWLVSTEFDLVDIDKACYQVDIDESLKYKDPDIKRVDFKIAMTHVSKERVDKIEEESGFNMAISLHLKDKE